MAAMDLKCAWSARMDFIPEAENTCVYAVETTHTLMEHLGPRLRLHVVSTTDQSINQPNRVFSKYTLVFFLFCIGLVELVELGEFN